MDALLYLGDKKRCPKCRQYKDMATEYAKNRGRLYGIESVCKDCKNKGRRKFKNRDDWFWKYFQSRVMKVGDCLEWNGGYRGGRKNIPSCRWCGKTVNVRRVVYVLSLGEVPEGMFVITTCRNQRCVRHAHLILATPEGVEARKANSQPVGERNGTHTHPERRAIGDRNGAYTHPERLPRGEYNGNAKLTEIDVRTIRDLYAQGKDTYADLARQFSVSKSTIYNAVKYKKWAHVQ